MATMGERIKQLRKENGWTQTELAAKLDVTKGTVSTWETDSRRPGFDKLDQLCDLFDRSMDYVSGLSDTPGHSRITREEAFDLMLSVEEEELTEYALKYARLDEYGRRAVQALIREEADRCLTQGTLEPVKSCSGNIRISRQYMLQEKDWQLESPTQER